MKKLFTLLIIMMPIALFSQEYLPMDKETKIVSYKEVVQANGSKDELFDRAKTWAVKTYSDYQSVCKLEDKESGKIILKGMQNVSGSNIIQSRIYYTFTIECRDGRYRTIFDDMYGEDKVSSKWLKKEMWMYNKLLENSLNEINSGEFKKKELEVLKHNSASYQATIKKTNNTINGLLSSLKQAMIVEEEEW